jgi:hypothetical protein
MALGAMLCSFLLLLTVAAVVVSGSSSPPAPCKSACPCISTSHKESDACNTCVGGACYNSTCGLKCEENSGPADWRCGYLSDCPACVEGACTRGQACGQKCVLNNQCDPKGSCPVCVFGGSDGDGGKCGKGVACGGTCTHDANCTTACSVCDGGKCAQCGEACDCGVCTCPMHRWCVHEAGHLF